jgi:hypothetical protein
VPDPVDDDDDDDGPSAEIDIGRAREHDSRARTDAEPTLTRQAFKITVSFKKHNCAPDLMAQQRREHCNKIIDRADEVFRELAEAGRAPLFTFSVEQGESDKGGHNYHVQGCAVILCYGDAVLAKAMLKPLMFALDYRDDAVKTVVYVESLSAEQVADEDFVGRMIAYTLKDVDKDYYKNARGGSEYCEEKCKAWVKAYEDSTVGVNTLGFQKSNFSMSGVKTRVKLDNMNLIPTVANFIRRQRLGIYQASFLRQV